MEKKTLNSFIDQQIIRFSLPDTTETRRKIRVKLLRTITQPKPNSYFKDNNAWEKAETTTVNGAKTKLLSTDDLTHLAEETQSYFENLAIKTGGLRLKEGTRTKLRQRFKRPASLRLYTRRQGKYRAHV